MKTTYASRTHRTFSSWFSRGVALLGALATLGAAGCATSDDGAGAEGEKLGEVESALFGNGLYWSTGTDGITEVPVCWQFSGYDADKEYVRSAIEGQWGAVTSVRFTGWGTCGASTPSNAIKISEGDETPHSNVGTSGSGVSMTLNFHYSSWNSYTYLNCECPPYDVACVFHSKRYYAYSCDYCSNQHEFCDGLIALHEFGHALGFYHEQDRPDNSGGEYCDDTVVTRSGGDLLTSSYDTDSVMNYCTEWDHTVPEISSGDVEGAIAAYGSRPSTLTKQVLIYHDAGFGGSVQALYPGNYNMSDLTIGNDALSSLRIPSGWTVQLFTDSNYGGSSVTLTSDNAYLGDVSFNDKASSIKVSGPSISYPVIYKDSGYSGTSMTLRPGVYSSSGDLGSVGNDAVSSLSVPSGWTVTLYTDTAFGGTSVSYTSSASSIGSFNDKTTSIKVVGPTGMNPVVIYKDASYKGTGQALWPGRYTDSDLSIGNDDLTSLTIPSGWTVMLMDNSPFWGEMQQYTSDTSSVSGDGFNDKTSSIVVLGPDP